MWNSSENGLTNIYLTTYFWFINPNWMATMYMGLILVSISFFLVWSFIPESPKWLYAKKRYADLRAVLIYMAKLNGVELNPEKAHIYKLGPHLDEGLGDISSEDDEEDGEDQPLMMVAPGTNKVNETEGTDNTSAT